MNINTLDGLFLALEDAYDEREKTHIRGYLALMALAALQDLRRSESMCLKFAYYARRCQDDFHKGFFSGLAALLSIKADREDTEGLWVDMRFRI